MIPVYVPSRGRAGNAPTIEALLGAGVVPRVYVHASEWMEYGLRYPDADVIQHEQIGIGNIRGQILRDARQRNEPHIWQLDDDIRGIRRRADGRYSRWPIADALAEMGREAAELGVAAASPQYVQFAFRAPDRVFNLKVTTCVWLDTTGSWDYWPHFHEDVDLTFQILLAGRRTLSWGAWALDMAPQGVQVGGCFDDYRAGLDVTAAEALRAKWEDRLPGIVKIGRAHV